MVVDEDVYEYIVEGNKLTVNRASYSNKVFIKETKIYTKTSDNVIKEFYKYEE